MALFFLEYELRKPRDYRRFYDEVDRFGAVRVLTCLWCFRNAESDAATLRNHFAQFMDADDAIVVVEVASWAARGALTHPNKLVLTPRRE